ncbi:uncharacterized protein MYCFIDRAFT_212572 [Pseudocercospora fijiensis CIRAD86]|uniref:Uncharacterized protein n=1 Tax=Pseudocercospora fijiensis (strain CIRAD86) TaxID=383855 RepID=M3AL23_PSEFD|nr:uncharacterized protein MYCFIDRAFT_212572 [Pseudocercospora fijiensis CIRAD86]EME77848.1 hypothetical protein MYCFIDRAFT_212572 [Pseudocercospora fijiensis CIRAD86]
MSPGREWRWLSNPQDFIAAAKLLIEEGQGPKSPSVALSEDIRSRLFVTPTPDTTGMDVDDVEVIDLGEGESTGQADVVAVIRPKDKPIRELLLAHAEASAREALAKQRKQDLIEGAYDAERGQEFLRAWREENNARIQKEGLEEKIETLFAASEA